MCNRKRHAIVGTGSRAGGDPLFWRAGEDFLYTLPQCSWHGANINRGLPR